MVQQTENYSLDVHPSTGVFRVHLPTCCWLGLEIAEENRCSVVGEQWTPKDVPVLNARTQNIAKGTLFVIKLMVLKWEIILNYLMVPK